MAEKSPRSPLESSFFDIYLKEADLGTPLVVNFSPKQLGELFSRSQFIREGVLLNDFYVRIDPTRQIVVHAPYAVGNGDEHITIVGIGKNGESGDLEDVRDLQIFPKSEVGRVTEMFDGALPTLPMMISAIVEEAFRNKIAVTKLAVDGESLAISMNKLRSKKFKRSSAAIRLLKRKAGSLLKNRRRAGS